VANTIKPLGDAIHRRPARVWAARVGPVYRPGSAIGPAVPQALLLLSLLGFLGTVAVVEPLQAATPNADLPASCQILDASGLPQISPAAIDFLERCLSSFPPTSSSESVRERIIAAAGKDAVCVSHRPPVAILTGGPPGAGKSTGLRTHAPLALAPGTLRIDADALRAQLPEYRGWNADLTQAETGVLVDRLLAGIGQPCRFDLLYDGTMSRVDRYRRLIPELRAMGYEVFLLQVSVPESLSRRRVLERYRAMGRYVSRAAITRYFATGPSTFEVLSSWADGYLQVDGLTGLVRKQGGRPFPSEPQPFPPGAASLR
jgi:predicted ABC-type ATPase